MIRLEELNKKFDQILREFPAIRKEFHEQMADRMENRLHTNIAGSLNDSNRHIRGMQEKAVGSGGGYAAVRAKGGQSGSNSPGAITNYLENGHRTRPSTKVSTERRIRSGKTVKLRVDGRHFYRKTRADIRGEVLRAAHQMTERLRKDFTK